MQYVSVCVNTSMQTGMLNESSTAAEQHWVGSRPRDPPPPCHGKSCWRQQSASTAHLGWSLSPRSLSFSLSLSLLCFARGLGREQSCRPRSLSLSLSPSLSLSFSVILTFFLFLGQRSGRSMQLDGCPVHNFRRQEQLGTVNRCV